MSATAALQATSTPEYNTPLELKCHISIPPQYMKHLTPYIDIMWLGPDYVLSQLNSNSTQTTVMEVIDLENLTSSLIFQSPTESINGDYSCQIILRLPREDLNVNESNTIPISLEGTYTQILITPCCTFTNVLFIHIQQSVLLVMTWYTLLGYPLS